ncbi:hypothetical protein [Roseateles saccharophilus]|nr:hypothetical protein [Roseateles saccharophilus]
MLELLRAGDEALAESADLTMHDVLAGGAVALFWCWVGCLLAMW